VAFDIGEVLKEMIAAAGKVIGAEAPKVKDCVKAAIKDEKDALRSIARARLAKKIDDDGVKEHIAEEKEALKVALLVCQIQGKVATQKAINAALRVFNKALKAAVDAI
jgi:hypothetical protein